MKTGGTPIGATRAFLIIMGTTLIFSASSRPSAAQESVAFDFQDHLFSARIEEAPLKTVLARLLEKKDIRYSLSRSVAHKRVSSRFEDLPLVEGIERILSKMNYSLIFDKEGDLTALYVFGKADPRLNRRPRGRVRRQPASRRTLRRPPTRR